MDDEFSDFMNTDETSDRRCVKRKLDVSYDLSIPWLNWVIKREKSRF